MAVTGLLCVAAFAVVPTDAWASEHTAPSAAGVADALAAVDEIDGSLLLTPTDDAGVGSVEVGQGTVAVPTSPDDDITMSARGQDVLSVRLPMADDAANAVVMEDGTVIYPGEEFSGSVIVSDIGVQMLTTIAGPESPVAYSYELSLEPGQTLRIVEDGAVVVNGDGSIVAAVAQPWARDADGEEVATHYEVDGSTLIQIVDHASAEGVAYPVVADPIWLAPWVVRCLVGIGINGPTITRIASSGSPGAVLAAFGYGAFRCLIGR
ncbi:hypothetical protein [Microbacterium sp. No. 7]|uniref:hypothetical protein n=1 Tax=Microbacterium sp. No. 7 TaxID=1714373 RepID=UPI0006ED3DC2|nr:hypothetical protein [Microbacterium sp. No. 7]ALJ21068.1 hypothetical protein AOA12_14625 [Microbacterium sp. No. 7]